MTWIRFFKVIREAGRGNVALAVAAMSALDGETLTAAERAFGDAVLGLLLATKDREKAIVLLERPVLLPAEKEFEKRRRQTS